MSDKNYQQQKTKLSSSKSHSSSYKKQSGKVYKTGEQVLEEAKKNRPQWQDKPKDNVINKKPKQLFLIIALVVAAIGFLGFQYHPEKIIPAETKYHPAITRIEPAVTRQIHHPAETKTNPRTCIKANIGNYAGQCATGRCRDGTYTGTPNTSYYLTCSYHGGLATLGPFYTGGETVVVKEAWTETIVDKPAETIVVEEAWTEVLALGSEEPSYWTWYGKKL